MHMQACNANPETWEKLNFSALSLRRGPINRGFIDWPMSWEHAYQYSPGNHGGKVKTIPASEYPYYAYNVASEKQYTSNVVGPNL